MVPEADEAHEQEAEVHEFLVSPMLLVSGRPEVVLALGMPKHKALQASGTGSMVARASGTGSMCARASGTGSRCV